MNDNWHLTNISPYSSWPRLWFYSQAQQFFPDLLELPIQFPPSPWVLPPSPCPPPPLSSWAEGDPTKQAEGDSPIYYQKRFHPGLVVLYTLYPWYIIWAYCTLYSTYIYSTAHCAQYSSVNCMWSDFDIFSFSLFILCQIVLGPRYQNLTFPCCFLTCRRASEKFDCYPTVTLPSSG